jgi:hypothetical protein
MFDKVRKNLQFYATADDAIVKIADTCVNYIEDSWYVSKHGAYTTFDAFDYAIADAVCYVHPALARAIAEMTWSNEVTKFYADFETPVGSANKNIHLKVQKGAGLLKKMNDVVDEIGIVKRVLNDQAIAMTSILRWRSQMDGSTTATQKPRYMYHPLERFTRLEQNARSVGNSVRTLSIPQLSVLPLTWQSRQLITLLDIWQRESIIDDERIAREESRQSRVLFVFTAVTVCFVRSWPPTSARFQQA